MRQARRQSTIRSRCISTRTPGNPHRIDIMVTWSHACTMLVWIVLTRKSWLVFESNFRTKTSLTPALGTYMSLRNIVGYCNKLRHNGHFIFLFKRKRQCSISKYPHMCLCVFQHEKTLQTFVFRPSLPTQGQNPFASFPKQEAGTSETHQRKKCNAVDKKKTENFSVLYNRNNQMFFHDKILKTRNDQTQSSPWTTNKQYECELNVILSGSLKIKRIMDAQIVVFMTNASGLS